MTTSSVALDHDAQVGEPTLALVGEPVIAPLSFTELNRRLSAVPDYDAPLVKKSRVSRVATLAVLISWLGVLLVPRLSLSATAEIVVLLCLVVVELLGLGIGLWFSRSEYVSLFKPLEDFAKQLDHDLPFHVEIRDWLAAQPITVLEKFASVARYRRDRFAGKLPILAGNISTLGAVPVIAVVYYQVKHILDDQALSWLDGVFGFAMILFYWLSMTMTFSKARLEAIDAHLQAALEKVRA
ncbi:hypothetical protein [Luteibacter yeojuensis]|uniref:Uncharacterized protein n=1 Tax=Luteibacter yeojuensis TaxID=345309 RepID=A0A0F3KFS1_9GAMM|nr:hypothetical protein [Luteibacter yeojuensis]KJV30016.1 hypothetical protein VI08_15225 [Luteibacter yeojuensis]